MTRILVVDDIALCREPIAEALRHQGYDVACADSGSSALSHLRDEGADLVLLDYSMPDLDGLSVLRVMRRNPAMKRIPVIMLTDRAERHFVTEAAQCGVNGYLLKSNFSLTQLRERVRACVGEASPQPVPAPAGVGASSTLRGRDAAAPMRKAAQTPRASGSSGASGRQTTQLGAAGAGSASVASTGQSSLGELTPILTKDELSALIGDGLALRPLGATAQHVMVITANANCCVEDIAKAVNNDQALAIRILKLANSSAYSRGRPITTVKDAVGRIGVQELRSIVTALDVIQTYECESNDLIDHQLFWEHSIACGLIAASINRHLRISETDDFFLWGMIHDVGRLILLDRVPQQYAKVCAAANALSAPLELVESRLLTLNHCEILEKALVQWQFPRDFIAPVINHHRRAQQIRHLGPAQMRAAAAVALADALAHALLLGSSGNDILYPLDDLADLLQINGKVIDNIIKVVPMETNELKISMLSRSETGAWPNYASTVRQRVASELSPLCLSLNPALDAVRLILERIASGQSNRPPNIAVLYARTHVELQKLASMLEVELQAIGIDNLPILVVLGKGKFTGGIPSIEDRPHVVTTTPLSIDALLKSVEQLAP